MVKSRDVDNSAFDNTCERMNSTPSIHTQGAPQSVFPGSALWLASQMSQNGQNRQEAASMEQPKSPHLNNGACGDQSNGAPIGLTALCAACSRLYPNQPNPLQVTARLKYWLGGPDPLDYISMYWNPGNSSTGVPAHWHYVSFGLSDLHGDGRVHSPPDRVLLAARAGAPHLNLELQSGFGLEMTFRLLAEAGAGPPMWPAALLQALARYVFKTGNRLCVGDHISWHSALDGSGDARNKGSRLRHMLVAVDPQLSNVETPLGTVQFVQIVGATARELRAAQAGRGQDVLDIMAVDPGCGGRWHVTDMTRVRSARGLAGSATRSTPSDLAGVSAVVSWSQWDNENNPTPELPQTVKEQIKTVLQKGLSEINASFSYNADASLLNPDTISAPTLIDCKMSTDSLKIERACTTGLSTDSLKAIFAGSNIGNVGMSTDSFEMSKIEDALIEEVLQSEIGDGDSKMNIKLEDSFPDFVKTESDWNHPECHSNFCQQHCPSFNGNECTAQSQGQNCCTDCQAELLTNGDPVQSNTNWCASSVAPSNANEPTPLKGVHLFFNAESGSLLPLALRGRVAYGRHFTWRSASGDQAITVLSSSVSGAFVNEKTPYAASTQGWLQILLTQEFALEMANALNPLAQIGNDDSEGEGSSTVPLAPSLPAVYCWPSRNIKITIANEEAPVAL